MLFNYPLAFVFLVLRHPRVEPETLSISNQSLTLNSNPKWKFSPHFSLGQTAPIALNPTEMFPRKTSNTVMAKLAFPSALKRSYIRFGGVISSFSKQPICCCCFSAIKSDTIMDLLNCPEARRAILDYYQTSGEPQAVQEAIRTSQENAGKANSMETIAKNTWVMQLT